MCVGMSCVFIVATLQFGLLSFMGEEYVEGCWDDDGHFPVDDRPILFLFGISKRSLNFTIAEENEQSIRCFFSFDVETKLSDKMCRHQCVIHMHNDCAVPYAGGAMNIEIHIIGRFGSRVNLRWRGSCSHRLRDGGCGMAVCRLQRCNSLG